jgi:hypothetical protein
VFEPPAKVAIPSESADAKPPQRPRVDEGAQRVFRTWLVIYALVGSQMAWILRPFIGTQGLEFALFRTREGSFFEGVVTALIKFMSGR